MALLVPILVALLAVAAFFLGVFDRPPFEYQDALLSGAPGKDLVAVVAVVRDADIAGRVAPLLSAVEAAVRAAPDGADLLAAAAAAYGGDAAGPATAVGFFFDDPKTAAAAPRWAVGYAVGADFARARLLAAQGGAGFPADAPLRAVRVPGDARVLRASVPWRTALTPMVAPMLHWDRGFAQHLRDHGESAQLALEVYLKGTAGERRAIDYIVYPDASVPLRDAFGEAGEGNDADNDDEDEEEEATEPERMEEETEEEVFDEAEAEAESEEGFEEQRQEEEEPEEEEEGAEEVEEGEEEEYQEEEE